MADTFTHIAIPAIFHRLFGRRIYVPVLLIGTILPDYLREFLALTLPLEFYSSIYIFHTFIGAGCVGVLGAALFRKNQRPMVFLSLFSGQLIHYTFDMVQGYLCPGRFYLLFPYRHSFEFGWLPESVWLSTFLFSLTAFLIFLFISSIKHFKSNDSKP